MRKVNPLFHYLKTKRASNGEKRVVVRTHKKTVSDMITEKQEKFRQISVRGDKISKNLEEVSDASSQHKRISKRKVLRILGDVEKYLTDLSKLFLEASKIKRINYGKFNNYGTHIAHVERSTLQVIDGYLTMLIEDKVISEKERREIYSRSGIEKTMGEAL